MRAPAVLAVAWSLDGALKQACDSESTTATTVLLLEQLADTEEDGLAVWNDVEGRTVEDVLALLDKAIQSLQRNMQPQ